MAYVIDIQYGCAAIQYQAMQLGKLNNCISIQLLKAISGAEIVCTTVLRCPPLAVGFRVATCHEEGFPPKYKGNLDR